MNEDRTQGKALLCEWSHSTQWAAAAAASAKWMNEWRHKTQGKTLLCKLREH